MFDRILVVCQGNICRSPVGMAMLQQRLPERAVQSAGLGALVGHPAEPLAAELAAEDGLDLEEHRARQLTVDMLQWADLVLVMSDRQRRGVSALDPVATGKTMLFGHWLGNDSEIPDPYRKSRDAFVHVHKKLNRAADGWQHRLQDGND